MSYLSYLCLLAYGGVQNILCFVFVLFVFVLCTLSCQFLWIVHFSQPLQYYLMFIYYYSEFIFKLVKRVRTEQHAKRIVIVKRGSVTKLTDVTTQKVFCKIIICIHQIRWSFIEYISQWERFELSLFIIDSVYQCLVVYVDVNPDTLRSRLCDPNYTFRNEL